MFGGWPQYANFILVDCTFDVAYWPFSDPPSPAEDICSWGEADVVILRGDVRK